MGKKTTLIFLLLIHQPSYGSPDLDIGPLTKKKRRLVLSADALHNLGYSFDGILGLGALAEVGLHTGHRHLALFDGIERESRTSTFASLKTGLRQGLFSKNQPGITLSILRQVKDATFISPEMDAAALGAFTSWEFANLSVYFGMMTWHTDLLNERGKNLHPFKPSAGLSFVTKAFPNTRTVGRLSWSPSIDLRTNTSTLDWDFTWGVTYNTETWRFLDIDLFVQHRGTIDNAVVSLGGKIRL